MSEQETLYTIALTRINYFNLTDMRGLYGRLGTATAIMEHRNNIREVLPEASDRLVGTLQNMDEPLHRAEIEMEWIFQHKIQTLCLSDADYPQRLKECDDAPLVLFYKGTSDLNQKRVISIVGTRRCTQYGRDLVRRFVADLKQYLPQLLIVSGLAYGIDINAHRNALSNNFDTVAVLAHGLDKIYPYVHRETAKNMVRQGGLLTEYMTETIPGKRNFVRRNRIVAGLSDACIVVESADKGGALITAGIARSYNRDVFAFPGNVGSRYSEGCNNLIKENIAGLISGAEDFIRAMNWQEENRLKQAHKEGIERQLFPDLSSQEQKIVDVLSKNNDLQINMLSVQSAMPIANLTAVLFALEMKGVVKSLAGGMYHLLK